MVDAAQEVGGLEVLKGIDLAMERGKASSTGSAPSPPAGPGTGAALKLVLINAVIGGVALIGEALTLADSLGLPRDLALRTLGAGPLAGAVGRAPRPAPTSPSPWPRRTWPRRPAPPRRNSPSWKPSTRP
ncbi:hypothetical protein [Streptomyces sp. NPDC058335]|uniref:hypothetical protein n=1 Tax=Streptomyces sp. NPDC058335 TaxID=3346451 RepID=UPI00365F1C3D